MNYVNFVFAELNNNNNNRYSKRSYSRIYQSKRIPKIYY